ncbi:MAG: endolytic transglycosylase MltG, partial [Desulfobacula sp.]|nr:endolytic transglycosylase MltG [Desulfobacula sp.]
GLPMGPIANPGAKSLQAALYPAQTGYLFFVSKKDTTHQFSKTIQEHNQAVKKYQLRKK